MVDDVGRRLARPSAAPTEQLAEKIPLLVGWRGQIFSAWGVAYGLVQRFIISRCIA